MTAQQAYTPGEEILISYGRKTNEALLLSYGFVPPPNIPQGSSLDLRMEGVEEGNVKGGILSESSL
ncbi:hypothetical protein T484DRAFT_1783175 [Baffinella frigidus]|nr:hypothetical protein T484DRAFT_1783175 [Cryptophyta sp. CCMP2293]